MGGIGQGVERKDGLGADARESRWGGSQQSCCVPDQLETFIKLAPHFAVIRCDILESADSARTYLNCKHCCLSRLKTRLPNMMW
jgi:hypothetical protein